MQIITIHPRLYEVIREDIEEGNAPGDVTIIANESHPEGLVVVRDSETGETTSFWVSK